MSVLIETSVGSFTVDLYTEEAPAASKNFLKLCKAHYFHGCLFFNVQPDFIVQTGDPTGTGRGGSSLNGLLYGEQARFMDDELRPQLRHNKRGKLSFVRYNPHVANSLGSQWIITLRDDCSSMDDVNTVFGEVVDGWDTIDKLNAAFCDDAGRPLVDVRIKHTYALLDPFDDPPGFDALLPDGGASPAAARPAAEVRQRCARPHPGLPHSAFEFAAQSVRECSLGRTGGCTRHPCALAPCFSSCLHADRACTPLRGGGCGG